MARVRAQTQIPRIAFVAIAVCFVHLAVWDLRHADVVVISEFLSGITAMAMLCGLVVVCAMVNYCNTLVMS